MARILKQSDKSFEKAFSILLRKRDVSDLSIETIVEKIINKVKSHGDEELLKLTKKFDKFNPNSFKDLIVSESEINAAYNSISQKLRMSLKKSIQRVKSFHSKQKPKNMIYKDKQGVLLGSIWNPLESVGLYVPGGKAAYPSSFIMNAVPAIVAGVPRIVITVPATNGEVNSLVLACCKMLNITEIYKIGGAQAIAALALGTKPTLQWRKKNFSDTLV